MDDVINVANADSEELVRSVCPTYPPEENLLAWVAPLYLTAGLFAIAAVGIVSGTWLMWEMPFGSGTLQLGLCFLLGTLLALPVLFSTWACFGELNWLLRIPLAMGGQFCLLCLYLLNIQAQSGVPEEVYWMISIITLAINVVAQVPMWILRILRGARIGCDADDSVEIESSQFSIKQLLFATTFVAVSLTVVQWLWSQLIIVGQLPDIPVFEMAGFCGIFMLDMGVLTALSLCIVMSQKFRRLALALLFWVLAGVSIASVGPMLYVLGIGSNPLDRYRWLISGNVLMFSASFSLTLVLVFSIYRLAGYQFRFRARSLS